LLVLVCSCTGIALEAKRVDMVRESIQQSGRGKHDMLIHAFDLCQSVVPSRRWRREVLQVLVSCLVFRIFTSFQYLLPHAKSTWTD
jgi:hypothetical protein